MKERGAIRHTLNECQLSREENEIWDGEPDMYINQGWIEALEYVLRQINPNKYDEDEIFISKMENRNER